MDPLDAFAPPTIRPTIRPTTPTPAARPLAAPGPAPGPAPWPSSWPAPELTGRPHPGRAAAVVSLAAGLAAVGAAALGSVLLFHLTPLVLVAVLGTTAVVAGLVALVRSRARAGDVALLSAGGGVSALVAAVVATTTLLFPFGTSDLDEAFAAVEETQVTADEADADLLAAMEAEAAPLGTTQLLGYEEVTVVAVHTRPTDVAARLEGMDSLRDDVDDVPDLVLVELEAPYEDGSWVPLLEEGDVTVVTAEGLTYSSWHPERSPSYDIDADLGSTGGGRGRALVVVAVPMPHVEAEGGLVAVTSPSWTDMATWEATDR